MNRKRRTSRAASLLLLAILAVASVSHLWHHVTDPGCGSDGRHGTQPCATCAGLHSAVVAARTQPPPQPHQTPIESIATLVSVIPTAAIVPGGAPRAPPSA